MANSTEPDPCAFHSSDGWVAAEALIAIFAGLLTIVLVVLRHPFKLLFALLLIAVISATAGWWWV